MLLQARVIFYIRTGKMPPAISQGGYNIGAVSASAGTHDRDALDFATSGWSNYLQKEWELALWMVGFAAWWRRPIRGLWSAHNHALPKGGDLSRGAKNQEKAFENKRDGLAGNGPYPRIGKYAYQTWEKYVRAKEPSSKKTFTINGKKVPQIKSVSVAWVNEARKTGAASRHVFVVQSWLRRLGFYKDARDGKWGPSTQLAMDEFRKSLGWDDYEGAVGLSSLQWLRLKAKTTRLIREGK
jgi:hypothetical protein